MLSTESRPTFINYFGWYLYSTKAFFITKIVAMHMNRYTSCSPKSAAIDELTSFKSDKALSMLNIKVNYLL